MSIKLLLADDSITIQKVVGIIFAGAEYDLTVVDNGIAAIEKAKEVMPDMVLVDALMPGKNGYEVCQTVRQDPALQHLPLLLLTGAFEPFDEEKARQCGADDFITKPFESQQLMDRVNKLLALGKDRPAGGPAVAVTPAEELVADQDDWAAMTAPDLMATETPAPVAAPEPEPVTFSSFESAMSEAPAASPEVQVSSADDLWGAFEMEPVPAAEADSDVQDLTESQFVTGGDDLAAALGAPMDEQVAPAGDWGAAPADDDYASETFVGEPADTFVPEPADVQVGFTEDSFAVEPVAEPEPVIPAPAFAAAAIAAPVEFEPAPAAAPVAEAAPAVAAVAPAAGTVTLSDEQLAELVAKISRDVIERIAWEVVPDLAETIIKEEIRKIKEGR